jgi:hypothetical protein
MMQIHEQVCSIDNAKRLRELGVKQEGLYRWIEIEHCMKFNEETQKYECIETRTFLNDGWYNYQPEIIIDKWVAFTVAELGELLPNILSSLSPCLTCIKLHEVWEVAYGLNNKIFGSHKEADARAMMLIHLLENKLIEIKSEYDATPIMV